MARKSGISSGEIRETASSILSGGKCVLHDGQVDADELLERVAFFMGHPEWLDSDEVWDIVLDVVEGWVDRPEFPHGEFDNGQHWQEG